MGQITKLWVHPTSLKIKTVEKLFKLCFCLLILFWVEISGKLDHTGGERAHKTQKGFHGWWVHKYLKHFTLTTTNAILMKLTAIMYLYKIIRQKIRGITHRELECINKKHLRMRKNQFFGLICKFFLDYIKIHNMCDILSCTASLVNLLYKLGLI